MTDERNEQEPSMFASKFWWEKGKILEEDLGNAVIPHTEEENKDKKYRKQPADLFLTMLQKRLTWEGRELLRLRGTDSSSYQCTEGK